VRRLLFFAAALLVVCGAVVAADKLSELAKKKVGVVQKDLSAEVRKAPLDFSELSWIQLQRLDREGKEERGEYEESDPLITLYALRYATRKRIRELNPYWEPERKPRKKHKYTHKEYDITDMVTVAPHRYAPSIGFGSGYSLRSATTRSAGGGGGIIALGNGDDEGAVGAGFDWEKIEEILERFLPEDPEQRRWFRYSGGKLLCYVTEEDVKIIETILGQLRRTTGYAINIEVKYLRADTKYLAGLRKQGDGSTVYLSDKAEQKLLEDAAKNKDVEVIASSEVIAANDQVVHIREGQQVSMLMDYDINTVGIPTLQPVVKLVNEGLICQFRPVVFHGGRDVSLDVMASFSKIRKEIRKGEFLGGELMFPAMDMSRLRTSVQVPSGKAVLVGGVAKSSGSKEDAHEYVVYIKPTVNRKAR
jgi:hypothetical protein